MKTTPDNLIEKGKALFDARAFHQAEHCFRAAIKNFPGMGDAHFQLGRIFAARGCSELALKKFETARHLLPEITLIWKMQAQALRYTNDLPAKDSFLHALKDAPLSEDERERITGFLAYSPADTPVLKLAQKKELARAAKLTKAGDNQHATALYKKLLKAAPDNAQILAHLARLYHLIGQAELGYQIFATALSSAPENASLHARYAQFLLAQNRSAEALRHVRQAVFLVPSAHNLRLLGEVMLQTTPDFSSLNALHQAIARAPEDALAHTALARAYLRFNAPNQALVHAKKARQHVSEKKAPEIALLCAEVEIAAGVETPKTFEALESFSKQHPDLTKPYQLRLNAGQMAGDLIATTRAISTFMEAFPKNPEPYIAYVKSAKIAHGDPILAEIRHRANNPAHSLWHRAGLESAYAKACEDMGEDGVAFEAFEAGAKYAKSAGASIEMPLSKEVDAVISAIVSEGGPSDQNPRVNSSSPIFITGLPRSGTTLVEQIIASHPYVTGGGELGVLPKIVHGACGVTLPEMVPLSLYEPTFFTEIGEAYMDFISEEFGDKTRITDKSIMIFLYLGILHKALPNAKVIIVRRNPRDNLLSIYKNLFAQGTHGYSYDLEALGHHYNAFARMVRFWREKLGPWFYELSYEELVSDTNAQARALIDFCALEWDPACLDFHKSKRNVKTLSAYQVRKPIYQSSIKSWQKYEKQLEPLFKILDEGKN